MELKNWEKWQFLLIQFAFRINNSWQICLLFEQKLRNTCCFSKIFCKERIWRNCTIDPLENILFAETVKYEFTKEIGCMVLEQAAAVRKCSKWPWGDTHIQGQRKPVLPNSMKLWAMPCRATQDGQVMVESTDKMWSIRERNGRPLQYFCLENPMSSMKRQKRKDIEKWTPQAGRCPICYCRRVEK